MNLSLKNLKDNKIDILKAEIGALLFNLGKTHIGIKQWRSYSPNLDGTCFEKDYRYPLFKGYKQYYSGRGEKKSPFGTDTDRVDPILRKFFDSPINSISPDDRLIILRVMYGNSNNPPEFIKKMFFLGCESVNSGIDKGSPKEKLDSLWIANAFGSFEEEVNEDYFDRQRLCFFHNLADKLHQFHKDIEYFNVNDWTKVRNFVFEEIKTWYSHLLSDSRFPANDVTLWDQAYMTATLFKATVAAIFLPREKLSSYQDDPQCIHWRILGIQYDKLGLAEKGLKSTYINWYRDRARKVDDSMKELLETEYPLGNEIYRDETGIYFLVPENIEGKQPGNFYLLSNDLEDIQENILEIFTQNFGGEIYPAIFLAEASRGTMNIAHLIEKAKENFLKAIYPNDLEECLKYDKKPNGNGICQVCGMRLAKRKGDEENNLICDVCREKKESRIDNWLKSINGETIWTGDLQDENGRIALITLKFELAEWLNGNLINSCLVQKRNWQEFLDITTRMVSYLKVGFCFEDCHQLDNYYEGHRKDIEKFLSLLDEGGIKEPFLEAVGELEEPNKRDGKYKQIEQIKEKKGTRALVKRIIINKTYEEFTFSKCKNKDDLSDLEIVIQKESIRPFKGKNNEMKINDRESSYRPYLHEIFSLMYLYHQIKAILLERSIGDHWEKFITGKLEGKINFDDRKIEWSDLNESDIHFLAQLLLQFLLRKNPSPARMRRIWETTQNFFYNIRQHIQVSTEIPEWRCKRLIWKKVFEGKSERSREYEYLGLDFWVDKKGTVYLISSLAAAIDALSDNQNKLDREEIKEQINQEKGDWLKKEIVLREYGKTNDKGLDLNLKDAKYKNFLPYFSILDPTPISYQFIIPADRVPTLIEKVQEAYRKEFKWVIGKLPLHIGVVIQNYKKPLYMGIKALRNIRHDIDDWDQIRTRIDAKSLKAMQKKAFSCRAMQENLGKLENFYSLYEKEQGEGSYEFYLRPQDKPVWLNTTQNANNYDSFIIYPNTVDFEFMDVNTRRNDIHYNKKGRRVKEEKRNRPYVWREWQIFYDFGNYFEKTKLTGKLQNIVSLIYSKLNDWKDNDNAIKSFLLSAFINVLDLKGKNEQLQKLDEFAKLLGQSDWNSVEDLNPGVFKETLWQFIDMFEFWHIHLKNI